MVSLIRYTAALVFCVFFMNTMATHGFESDDDEPFGPTTDQDLQELFIVAKRSGVDFEANMDLAYNGRRKGLEQVFSLATKLETMDAVTKVYANVIYSAFLNLVEERCEKYFAKALESQPPLVQQRIRDFIYYPVTQLQAEQRQAEESELKTQFPRVFPSSYVFGKGNTLFK